MRTLLFLVPLVMLLAACGGSNGHDHQDHHGHDHGGATSVAEEGVEEGVTPYPLDKCLVMDAPLDSMGGAHTLVHEGQEWKFCCGGCVATFKADPEHWKARLQAAVAEAEAE